MSDKESNDEGRKREKFRRCAYAECGKTEVALGEFLTCDLCVQEKFPHPNHYCNRECEVLEFQNRHKHVHKKAKEAPAGSELQKAYLERLPWARSKHFRGTEQFGSSVERNNPNKFPNDDSTLLDSLLRCANSKCENTEVLFSCDMCLRRNRARHYCSVKCKNLDFLDGHMYQHNADPSDCAPFYERLQSAVSQRLDLETDPEEQVVYNIVNSENEEEERGAVGGPKVINIVTVEPDYSPRPCSFADCDKQEEFYGRYSIQCEMCFLEIAPRCYCSVNCLNSDFLNQHWRSHAEAFHEPRHSMLRFYFFTTLNIALKELVGNSHNNVNSHAFVPTGDQLVDTVQSFVNSSEYTNSESSNNGNDFSDILQCATNILSVLRLQLNQPYDQYSVNFKDLVNKVVETICADRLDVFYDGPSTPQQDASMQKFIEEWDHVAEALSDRIDMVLSDGTTRVGDEQSDSLHRCATDNCQRVALFRCFGCVVRREAIPKYFCGPLCENLSLNDGKGHQHKDLDFSDLVNQRPANLVNQLGVGEPGAVGGENDGCPPILVPPSKDGEEEEEEEEEANNEIKKQTMRGKTLKSQRHRHQCETCGVRDSRSSPTRHKACPLCYEVFKDGLPFKIPHRMR